MVKYAFNQVCQDSSLHPKFRSLFTRLMIPVLKYALLTPAFFTDKSHVIRKQLNKLVINGQLINQHDCDHTQTFLYCLELWVEQVIMEFSRELEHFEQLISRFSKQIQEQQKQAALSIRRNSLALSGLWQKQEVTENALQQLQKLQDKYTISEPIFELLHDGILPSLVLHGLNAKYQNEDYLSLLKLTHELVRSVQPHTEQATRQWWSQRFAVLQLNIRTVLGLSCCERGRIQYFLALLKQEQMLAIQGRCSIETQSKFDCQQLDDKPLKSKAILERIAQIKRGQWFDYLRENTWLRCHVAVNNVTQQTILLVDRLGDQVACMNYQQCASKLSMHQLKVVKRKDLFENALSKASELDFID